MISEVLRREYGHGVQWQLIRLPPVLDRRRTAGEASPSVGQLAVVRQLAGDRPDALFQLNPACALNVLLASEVGRTCVAKK